MTISTVEMEIPDGVSVEVLDDALSVEPRDGRFISVLLTWYPRLVHATPNERNNHRLIGKGQGIHGPSPDENISVEGLLAGPHSGESQASFKLRLDTRPNLQ